MKVVKQWPLVDSPAHSKSRLHGTLKDPEKQAEKEQLTRSIHAKLLL